MPRIPPFRSWPGLARIAVYATALGLLGGLAYLPLWWKPEPPRDANGTPVVSPWQIPGYKTGQQAHVWVDPETKCHYLVVGGSYSWGLVPRYDADGATLICNQPVPEEAK
jgi:hypothetical protein